MIDLIEQNMIRSSAASKHIRCEICKKKLGIMSHICKCERVFCISHLHAEAHQCSYHHQTDQRILLKKTIDVGSLSDKMTDRV